MKRKWVQLDLARQMESVDVIEEYISMMSGAGYNGILLYLEDRIKTESYPYPADNECYTKDEIRRLVAFADKIGMELIPCVATLGHAERFLRHPEMEHLAELQDGAVGRFNENWKGVFCPSNPRFHAFIESYLTEVAALFPSGYFHVGLDEFWSYCVCPRCRALAPDYAGETRFFAEHINRMHGILAKAGKRMMMWSDMFELYRDAMELIPADIIMIDWQYQPDVRFYLSHLLDCDVEKRQQLNRRFGFESMMAPRDFHLRNIASSFEYATKEGYDGFLLTSWEKSDIYLTRSLPMHVFAGLLMNGLSVDEAFARAVKIVFGTEDEIFIATMKLLHTNGLWYHFVGYSTGNLFRRNFYGIPYNEQEVDFALESILPFLKDKVSTGIGKAVLDDILDGVREKVLSFKLHRLYNNVFDGGAVPMDEIRAIHGEAIALVKAMEAKWEHRRPGITPNVLAAAAERIQKMFDEQTAVLEKGCFLKIRVCAPDGYGVQNIKISLHKEGVWTAVANRTFKPGDLNTALAECFVPVDPALKGASAVRLESTGIGGVGVCWLEFCGNGPVAVLDASGTVEHPWHLLKNNTNFAWFGDQCSRDGYFSSAASGQVHSITLQLGSVEP